MLHGEPYGDAALVVVCPGCCLRCLGEKAAGWDMLIHHSLKDHFPDVLSISGLPNGFLSVTVLHFLNYLKPEVLELLSLSHVFLT